MQSQRRKRDESSVRINADFRQVGDKIIGSAPWGAAGDVNQERFMVFTVGDGKIVDMQGFTSQREAERFAQRR